MLVFPLINSRHCFDVVDVGSAVRTRNGLDVFRAVTLNLMRGPRAHRKQRGPHPTTRRCPAGVGCAERREPYPRSRTSHATAPDDCPLRHTTDAEAMRDEAMLCSSNRGILVRTPGGDIGVVDRNTEGVRPIDLLEDERLVGMEGFEDYEQG
jgi:hypothetical protein